MTHILWLIIKGVTLDHHYFDALTTNLEFVITFQQVKS
jgi:hypothetical protein